MIDHTQPNLSSIETEKLIKLLKNRFENNMHRHKNIKWQEVQSRLEKNGNKLWSLKEMEQSGGEPDVISYDQQTKEYVFCDCSTESPSGRRNTCYDRAAQESRKKHSPENNAIDMATRIGIEILTEQEYRDLQRVENFDTKTSSWIKTPIEIRSLGGALYADRRYNQVFIYHNGAESYYKVRGFRGILRV